MEKKYVRLAVVGIVTFIVLAALIYIMLPEPVQAPGEERLVVAPYFMEGGAEKTGNFLTASIDGQKTEIILTGEGFPYNKLKLEKPVGTTGAFYHFLVLENDSANIMSILVTTLKKDGEDYAIKRFALAAHEKREITLFVPADLESIIASDEVLVEKTDDGIPLFEVSCVTNCNDLTNYISIYG